ncbi:MAG: SGNH/GDSL hydrolase family protein [Actinomycetes bacterium]
MSATLAVTDAKIGLLGRWRDSPDNSGSKRTCWQSPLARVAFTGTSLSVTLAKKALGPAANLSGIYCYVDGGDATWVAMNSAFSTATTVGLLSGLANTTHDVVVQFMENPYGAAQGNSYSDVTSFTTDGSFSQWVPRGPYVLVLGDSVSSIRDSWHYHLTGFEPIPVTQGGMALCVETGGGAQLIPSMREFYPYKADPMFSPGLLSGAAIAATDQQCSAILVMMGFNDASYSVLASTFKSNMESFIAQVRAVQGNIPVVLVTAFNVTNIPTAGRYRTVTGQVPSDVAGVSVVDTGADLPGSYPYWTQEGLAPSGDGIHIGTAGQKHIAALVQPVLYNALNPAIWGNVLALPVPPPAPTGIFGNIYAALVGQVAPGIWGNVLAMLAPAHADGIFGNVEAQLSPPPTALLETLRIYKHGSAGFADVTSATIGGFSEFTRTQVRNEPGSLEFTLTATTPSIFNAWLDEAATVEYWNEGVRKEIYYVDDFTPQWSALTCAVKCVGKLVSGKTVYYTGTFTGVWAQTALQTLVSAAGWSWSAGKVNGGTYVIASMSFADTPVLDAIQQIALVAGLTFWIDGNGVFCCEPIPSAVQRTYILGDTAHEFDTTYTAREIINNLVIACGDGKTRTFYDTASRASYGTRTEKVQIASITSAKAAQDYADAYFLEHAQPRRILGLTVDHDDTLRPGLKVSLSGLADGRAYDDIIEQLTWTLGDLYDHVQAGLPPLALEAQRSDVVTLGSQVPQPVGTDQLPAFESYFTQSDTIGLPGAPTNVEASLVFKTLILSWDLPSEALWRSWEVYEDVTAGFVPDTTSGNYTNRAYLGTQTVVTIKHDPSAVAYYYKLCAVNSRGERSPFAVVPGGPFVYTGLITQDFVDGAITAAKMDPNYTYLGNVATDHIIAGSALIGRALIASVNVSSLFADSASISSAMIASLSASKVSAGTLDCSQITVTNLDAGAITTGTLTGRVIQTASSGRRVVVNPSGSLGAAWGFIGLFTGDSAELDCSTLSQYSTGTGNARYPMTILRTAEFLATGESASDGLGHCGIYLSGASRDRSSQRPEFRVDLAPKQFIFDYDGSLNVRMNLGNVGYLKAPADGGAWQMRNSSDTGYHSIRALSFDVMSERTAKANIAALPAGAIAQVMAATPSVYHVQSELDALGADGKKPKPADVRKRVGLIVDELPPEIVDGEGYELSGAIAILWQAVRELTEEVRGAKK